MPDWVPSLRTRCGSQLDAWTPRRRHGQEHVDSVCKSEGSADDPNPTLSIQLTGLGVNTCALA